MADSKFTVSDLPGLGTIGTFKAMGQLLWNYRSLVIQRMRDENVKTYKYGDKRRSTLDVYLADKTVETTTSPPPCMIISVGSGWMFGHKIFGIPFGYLGRKLGITTVVIDYHRWPTSNIDEQIKDCTKAIDWVHDHIEFDKIGIAAYSAAGHIVLRSLLNRIELIKRSEKISEFKWNTNDFAALFLWSCPLDLPAIYEYQCKRSNVKTINLVKNKLFPFGLKGSCVYHRISSLIENEELTPNDMCPVHVANGDEDTTCQYKSALSFHSMLRNNGFLTSMYCINGWGHLDYAFKDVEPLAAMMHSKLTGNDDMLLKSDVLTQSA